MSGSADQRRVVNSRGDRCSKGWGTRLLPAPAPMWGEAVRCLGIHPPRTMWWRGAVRPQQQLGSITCVDPHHRVGSCRYRGARSRCRVRTSRRRFQAADLTVTYPVEHQGEELAGGGDPSDVGATTFSDPLVAVPNRSPAPPPHHGFDRGPPYQR